ncbi:hypothetical protein Hanom_Chr06g00540791 [Helianthus anomalus]
MHNPLLLFHSQMNKRLEMLRFDRSVANPLNLTIGSVAETDSDSSSVVNFSYRYDRIQPENAFVLDLDLNYPPPEVA